MNDTSSKVARVEAFGIDYLENNDASSTRSIVMVRIEDDDGCVGWGETPTLFRPATAATVALVDEWSAWLVGSEATPASARHAIARSAWWYGPEGISAFAASAIDIALWDLHSRAQNRSLVSCLGGDRKPFVPVLMSSHASLADLADEAGRVGQWVTDVNAVGAKIGFGKRGDSRLGETPERDSEFVFLLRDRLGDQPLLIVDVGVNVAWGVDAALRHIRAMQPAGIEWVEEPLGRRNTSGYRRLKDELSVRLGFGEQEWTPDGVRDILSQGSVDVVGLDPGRALGISGWIEADQECARHARQINAHAWAGPLVFAASLALTLHSPTARYLEVQPLRNELWDLVNVRPEPVDGHLLPLHGPGLGLEVDETEVRSRARATWE